MNIRVATLKDHDRILEIYDKTFKNTIRNPAKYYKKYIIAGNVMVLESNENIIGVYLWEINRMKDIYKTNYDRRRYHWMRQLMIDPEFQRNSFGSGMLDDFKGRSGLEKRLVCEEYLVGFYEKSGYVRCGNTNFNDKELAIMRHD